MALKTHGMVLDESDQKMCKTFQSLNIDPENLISGSVKLSGKRQHGYGTDVLRLWASSYDSDKNFKVVQEDIEDCNTYLKVFRKTCRNMVGNLNGFEIERDGVKF